jgi:hypothetical protein
MGLTVSVAPTRKWASFLNAFSNQRRFSKGREDRMTFGVGFARRHLLMVGSDSRMVSSDTSSRLFAAG